jgi:hypothetical protein
MPGIEIQNYHFLIKCSPVGFIPEIYKQKAYQRSAEMRYVRHIISGAALNSCK